MSLYGASDPSELIGNTATPMPLPMTMYRFVGSGVRWVELLPLVGCLFRKLMRPLDLSIA